MTKRVTVRINSGSSLSVKHAVIRMLGVNPSLATVGYDDDGNVTSVEAVVPDSSMPALQSYLPSVPGVESVSFEDDPDPDAVPASVGNWVLSTDVSVQFAGGVDGLNGPAGINRYSGAKEGTALRMVVTNGSGAVDILNGVSTVTVAASGGTAPRINGSASPVTLRFANGVADVVVTDSAPGEVAVSMTASTHPFVSLAHDTAAVTLS